MNWKQKLPDPFVIGLVFMVFVASFFPFRLEYQHFFPLQEIIYWGITGIFFLYGLKLDPKKIRQDMGNWKLHMVVQLTTFMFFPLIVLIFHPLFVDSNYYLIWLATFYLAVLPSTVSSSVVMVSIAKGNLPAAIFNASMSGLFGLVLTPLWMSLFLARNSNGIALNDMIQQLILQLLLPVLVGLMLNRFLSKMVRAHQTKIAWFDKIVIFLIVYKSFSAAFLNDVFSQVSSGVFAVLTAFIILLFFCIYVSINWVSLKLSFSREDTITALFCGSKKSLVHGSVFVTLLIPDIATQSLFLLPIMLYHAFQLFYTSYKAKVFSRTVETNS